MTGTQAYNKQFDINSKKRIKDNADKKYLEDFYYFMLADTSYSASYGYLGCVINFVNSINLQDAHKVALTDYTKYLASIKDKTASYKIMVYSALKKFSKFLRANEIAEDYMQFIKRPKFKETQNTKDKREKGFMTEDEISMFINNVRNSNKPDCWRARDIAIVSVLLNSGIRCSALHKLDLGDLNKKERYITVLEKGDVSRRIYLSESTINNLENWLKYRSSIMGNSTDPAMFVSDHKARMNRRTIYNMIKAYGVNIEGKNITPHKTRATFGTQLYEKTHDLYFVQECMGHSNPKTTETYIRGQRTNVSKKASELISDMLK